MLVLLTPTLNVLKPKNRVKPDCTFFVQHNKVMRTKEGRIDSKVSNESF